MRYKPHMDRVGDAVDRLQASGSYTFTSREVGSDGGTEAARRAALGRLGGKGRILAVRRGFYVIIPLEYRSAGAPPPPWWIDALMRWQGHPYYVGLLSAASIHGAAHQAPQVFQVVTDRPLRPIRAGRHEVRFMVSSSLEGTPTTSTPTPTGSMKVSTPEATAIDLVRYARVVGHLEHVLSLLAELADRLGADEIVAAARTMDPESSVLQRLGYLLDRVGRHDLTPGLASEVDHRDPPRAPLVPGLVRQGPVDPRWRLVVNTELEVEP
jgi:predicted transcriptional regulator of viral defense system